MKLIMIVASLAGALLTACATYGPYSSEVQSKLGDVTDRIHITSIKERTLPDGTLKLAVTAVSQTRFDQNIRYRVNWFDGAGMPIASSVSAFQNRSVSGDTEFDFVSTGPGPKAKNYKIDILTEGE